MITGLILKSIIIYDLKSKNVTVLTLGLLGKKDIFINKANFDYDNADCR